MTQDTVSDLERKLRQDAERVSDTQNHSTPVAELLERHSERQRQNNLVRAAGVTLLAFAIPAAWVASLLSTNGAASKGVTMQPSQDKLVVVAPPSVPQPAERNSVLDPGTANDGAQIVPIMFVRTNAAGEQVLVHGLYVPQRSESIDISQLSQVQQRAVRTVLGMAKPPETQRPF